MKLVTSVAALDLLGPAYTWQTQVLTDGTIDNGTLRGRLFIKGGGDPKLVVERLWLLLQRVRSLGIHTIDGDIVLDRSAFDLADKNPAQFDGEPTRPYNASPDALLINFKSLVMTFTPMGSVATVHYDPPLYGVQLPPRVPLSNADCGDYRTSLKADLGDAKRIRFLGRYPASCGERTWPIAYADPVAFSALAIRGLWESMGGRISGTVRDGALSPEARPAFSVPSATLAEVLRDINKFSNNVMAQQVFLSLSLAQPGGKAASLVASRSALLAWWKQRYGASADALIIDNGSGLSRQERITAQSLARMLQSAYAAPYAPELIASLPQTGVDGTLRRSQATAGAAHLKTGSLSSVVARAGYVDAASPGKEGTRYVLVAIVNSSDTAVLAGARAMMDALVDWTARQ